MSTTEIEQTTTYNDIKAFVDRKMEQHSIGNYTDTI